MLTNLLANTLDITLILVAVLTVLLIGRKTLELAWPGLLGEKSIEARATSLDVLEELLEAGERGMPLLATITTTSPFVGLAATILHIVHVLTAVDFSVAGADFAAPIGMALKSTLLGLASAVPAAVAYNLLARRLQLAENRARRALARQAASREEGGS